GAVSLSGAEVVVSGNRFTGNEIGRELGYGWGGALFIHSEGTAFISRGNVYADNFASSGGGGIFVDNGARGLVTGDVIYGNGCARGGGAGILADSLDDGGTTGSVVDVDRATITDNRCNDPEAAGTAALATGAGSEIRLKNS